MAWGICWHTGAKNTRACSCLSTLLSAAISFTCLEHLLHSWNVSWISPHHILYLANYGWHLSFWPVMNLWTYSVCEVTRAGQSILFIHQSTAPSMYMSLASPSKFHQPKPNRWCTHFVVSKVSETGGHRKYADHKDIISDIISCLQHFSSIQYNWCIRFKLMYFTVSVWFLNSFILVLQESESTTALTKVNMCCHLWDNQTDHKRERQMIYGNYIK